MSENNRPKTIRIKLCVIEWDQVMIWRHQWLDWRTWEENEEGYESYQWDGWKISHWGYLNLEWLVEIIS